MTKFLLGFRNKEMLLTFIKHFNWANGVHSNNNELKSKIGIGKQDEHKFKSWMMKEKSGKVAISYRSVLLKMKKADQCCGIAN